MGAARILAIDDSEQNLLQVQLYLEGGSFEVTTARSGSEAFDVLRERSFDLILLDVVLPRMDGFEICRRLKADPRTASVPVIFLTGRRRDESAKLIAFEVGGVDYLAKPFRKDELIARIRVMLRLRAQRAELEAENRALLASLEDVRRRLAGVAVEASEHRALLEAERTAAHGVLLLASDGAILDADPAARAILGSGAEGATPVAEACRAAVADGVATLTLAGAAGEPREVELRATRTAGGWTVVAVRDTTVVRGLGARVARRQPAARAPEGVPPVTGYRVAGLIGESPRLLAVSERVSRLRDVRTTVLIQGETGTGKELVARALHFDGRFAARPFIPIHCGAISPDLIESELFGYEKGAFTGAQTSKKGLFTAADGGTVFLDEVAETSFDLQVKLLRVLQLGEVRPVGATNPLHVDVRIIAATNRDLAALVEEGRFRADLFYRLDCVAVRVPALRDRPDDVPALVHHFLAEWNRRLEPPTPVRDVAKGALEYLQRYPWPGNVRELENVIKRAISLGAGEVIQEHDLPERIRSGRVAEIPRPSRNGWSHGLTGPLRDRHEQVDENVLRAALERFGGDKMEVARFLQISRSTLYRKLKRFGMV